jgi:hypothetical protein
MKTFLIRILLWSFGLFAAFSGRAQGQSAEQELIQLLQQTLESCRKENERLLKLLPDSLKYPQTPSKKPLTFRGNNITWNEHGKQISVYQVISELSVSEMQTRVISFLNSRGYVADFSDTLRVDPLILPELHPVKVRSGWIVEPYEPGFSALKVWFRMPDGTYLNPDNYPGYHSSIQTILKRIFYGAE